MNSELVRMWKEAVVLSVEVVFKYLSEGTEEKDEVSLRTET